MEYPSTTDDSASLICYRAYAIVFALSLSVGWDERSWQIQERRAASSFPRPPRPRSLR